MIRETANETLAEIAAIVAVWDAGRSAERHFGAYVAMQKIRELLLAEDRQELA